MWIWLLALYALVGVVVSIWLPISLARTRARLQSSVMGLNPELMGRLTPDQRRQVDQLAAIVKSDFSALQIFLAGLLWPLQIVGFFWSRKLSKQISDATRCNCGQC